jgi:hypothetical protein
VDRLYGKYSPEKLGDVDTLVAKYGEVKLLGMVRKKYAEQEGLPASPPAAAAASPSALLSPAAAARASAGAPAAGAISPVTEYGVSPERVEVDSLYGKYNPEKLGDVDTLVAKYGEVKLLAMVRKKYAEREAGAAAGGVVTATFVEPGPPRRGPFAILPPPFPVIWRINIGATDGSDE